MSEDKYNLERFVREQEHSYDRAYQGEGVPVALLFEPTGAKRRQSEGSKRSHWMWWIFPQIVGLGKSRMT